MDRSRERYQHREYIVGALHYYKTTMQMGTSRFPPIINAKTEAGVITLLMNKMATEIGAHRLP